jgi:hypothetical protein
VTSAEKTPANIATKMSGKNVQAVWVEAAESILTGCTATIVQMQKVRKFMTTIKDLKSMAEGTEIKGLPLMIKTARKTFRDAEGTTFQEVVFMDASGEMTGHILLESTGDEPGTGHHEGASGFKLWQSKTNLCIMDAVLQSTDERKKEGNKLVVFDCFNAATPLSYDQQQDLQAEDWKRIREDEIRGKVRHWVVCSYIQNKGAYSKNKVREDVEFIVTGE